MFSKEASRKLREDFWISFGKSFPRKWILYNTKVKDFAFKFHFDTKTAIVSLDLDHHDLEKRIALWDKLLTLKSILTEEYLPDAIFNDSYVLENRKEISRIYLVLEGVSIHNKDSWQEAMVFLNRNMLQFEAFFEEYKDILIS